jgi:hypothetical protein
MGVDTLLITHNVETLGQMSCNPAIGGIGKGHLVKEIDAMGGIMAKAIDLSGIQFRTLNASKGPAVRATRAQADRILYKAAIRKKIENQENLSLFQQPVDDLIIENNSHLRALPVLRADTASSREMMENYQLMAELLVPTGLKIAELQRDSLGVWYIDTAPGLRMVIGRDQLSEKIRRFNLVWAAGLNKYVKNIAAVDLRYPNGLAVAWRETALALQQSTTDKDFEQDSTQDSMQLNNTAPVQAYQRVGEVRVWPVKMKKT